MFPKIILQRKGQQEEKMQVSTRTAARCLSEMLSAMRPWSFPASLTPVGLGACLAYRTTGVFNIWIFLTTCFTVLCIHAAGNLANTYMDYIHGVDNEASDDKTLVHKRLTTNEVFTMCITAYVLGCIGYLALVFLSPARLEHLEIIYLGGLAGSFLYSAGLKYIALGDIIIFLCFGPVTVWFAYIAQGGSLHWTALWYSLPLAFHATAMLHGNNARDMRSDSAAGIFTVATLLGERRSYMLFVTLLLMPYILILFTQPRTFLLPLVTIFQAIKLEGQFRGGRLTEIPQKLAMFNLQFSSLYIIACLLLDRDTLLGL